MLKCPGYFVRSWLTAVGRRSRTLGSVAASVAVFFAGAGFHSAFTVAQEADVANDASAENKVTYDDDVQPLLNRRCSSCHSNDRTEGDLNVTSYSALMAGGSSGGVIEPGSADDSYLFRLVNHDDSPKMPPSDDKIPDKEIELLRRWIDGGSLEHRGSKAVKKKVSRDLSVVETQFGKRPDHVATLPEMENTPLPATRNAPPIRSIAVSPWSPLVAIAGSRQVLLFDTKTLEQKGIVPFEGGQPRVIRFSRNGSLLLMAGGRGGESGRVWLWDVATAKAIGEFGNERDEVLAADISREQHLVAMGGPGKVARVYATSDGAMRYEISRFTNWITAIAFSPDGDNLAVGDRDGNLAIFDAETGELNFALDGHKTIVSAITWRPDARSLASSSDDGVVKTWRIADGKQIKSWAADKKGVLALGSLRDGSFISGGRDGIVNLWRTDGKNLKKWKKLKGIATAAAFCDESNRLIAGSDAGEVLVWDKEGNRVGELDCNPASDAHEKPVDAASVD